MDNGMNNGMDNGMEKKTKRKKAWSTGMRICRIAVLTFLGLAVAAVILGIYGERVEEVFIGSPSLAFAPVYNRNGSWMHGRLKIGYRPEILMAEHVITLLLLCYLSRFIDYISMILGMSRSWGICMDLGIAATLARLINVIAKRYTLDYIYIRRMHATYDLVDFYLGIGILIMLVWVFLCEIRVFRLKKQATQGLGFRARMRWELVFTGNACRAVFMPREGWEDIRERYGYYLEKGGQETAGI